MNDCILFLCNSEQLYRELLPYIDGIEGYHCMFYSTVDEVRHMIPKIYRLSPDAIVALPSTADALLPLVNIPFVPLSPSPLDFLDALMAARSDDSEEVHYIGYSHSLLVDELSRFEAILNRKIVLHTYLGLQERERIINEIPGSGVRIAAVTSNITKLKLEQCGGKGILITRGKLAIQQTIYSAHQLIASKRAEAERNDWLTHLLDNIHNGVIGIDADGAVTDFNKLAASYLCIPTSQVIGKKVTAFPPESPIGKLFQGINLHKSGTEIHTINNRTCLVTVVPIKHDKSLIILKDESEIKRLQTALSHEAAKRGMVAKYTFSDIVGECPATVRCINLAKKLAQSDATVLLVGETGVGKELFAQSIHNSSSRKTGPFVAINCAAIPEGILESELFGYEGGSFTGALREGKRGLFELANGGTLFLDEIGEMPISLQSRLLRVLQNKEIMHLGGKNVIPVDVRIIAATNQDLEQAIKQKTFRQDLFYRISMFTLRIPSLKERREDIPALAQYFIQKKNIKYGKNVPPPDDTFISRLMARDWPGNVRELENAMERYVFLYDLAENDTFDDLSFNKWQPLSSAKDGDLLSENKITVDINTMEEMERQIISILLNRYSISELAAILGISRSTIWRKCKETAAKHAENDQIL